MGFNIGKRNVLKLFFYSYKVCIVYIILPSNVVLSQNRQQIETFSFIFIIYMKF